MGITNPALTAIMYKLRLGQSELNIEGYCNRDCQCGSVTEHHIFFESPSSFNSEQLLLARIQMIIEDKGVISCGINCQQVANTTNTPTIVFLLQHWALLYNTVALWQWFLTFFLTRLL